MHPNDQSEYHSVELQAKVGKIALYLRVGAVIISVFGFLFALLGMYLLLDPSRLTPLTFQFIAAPVLGLAAFAFGLFELKLTSDFEKFRPWTYHWVEFLTRSSWRWGRGFGGIYSPEVHKAFHQPEFEYPDHPEYGYKIEQKK